jgi:hypothetical protein
VRYGRAVNIMELSILSLLLIGSTVSEEYQPSWAARVVHGIPHLNYKFKKQPRDWNATSSTLNLDNPYIKSLVTPGVIVISVGFALILTFLFFWAVQHGGGITTRPSEKLLQQMPMSWARTVATRKQILSSAFTSLVVSTFLTVVFSLYAFYLVGSATPGVIEVATIFRAIDSNGSYKMQQ